MKTEETGKIAWVWVKQEEGGHMEGAWEPIVK